MTVDVPGARLVTKLIDATYPDYSRAIPLDGDKVMLVDRQTLKDALSRTAILSNELYRNVRLILLQDRLDMHTNNPSTGRSRGNPNCQLQRRICGDWFQRELPYRGTIGHGMFSG